MVNQASRQLIAILPLVLVTAILARQLRRQRKLKGSRNNPRIKSITTKKIKNEKMVVIEMEDDRNINENGSQFLPTSPSQKFLRSNIRKIEKVK